MCDKERLKLFGSGFCDYFGFDFIEHNLRIELSVKQFDKEIIKLVLSQRDLKTKLVSFEFWIQITDWLDLLFTVQGCGIKSGITWQKIVGRFFNYLLPNSMYFSLIVCFC